MISSFKDMFLFSLEQSCQNQKFKMKESVRDYISIFYSEVMLHSPMQPPDRIIGALLLFDACQKTDEMIRLLKQNGDYYFFTAGWAPEHLCSRNEDLQRNLDTGLNSYRKLDSIFGGDSLYGDLAIDYKQLIFVLNETFDLFKIGDKSHILMNLDCWKKTNHPIFKKRLLRAGMQIVDLSD